MIGQHITHWHSHSSCTQLTVRVLTSSSSCWWRSSSTLPTAKSTKPPLRTSTWWTTSPPSRPVVSTVSLSLFVGTWVYEGHEEVLDAGNEAPEEVSDGAESPRLGLENSPIWGNVHHVWSNPDSETKEINHSEQDFRVCSIAHSATRHSVSSPGWATQMLLWNRASSRAFRWQMFLATIWFIFN